jgi:hypothetical protein
MTLLVYGLLPRIVTLTIARSRLRAAARAAVHMAPGVSALLRRIHRAQIETRAIDAESSGGRAAIAEQMPPATLRTSAKICAVINWSEVPVRADALSTHFPGVPIFAAGGSTGMQDDIALAKRLATTVGNADSSVLIVVKAWEPPLMEFIDFLKTLRSAVGGGAVIAVLPVGLDDADTLGRAAPTSMKLWRDKLAGIGDPWLRVAASREEVSS